MTKNMGAERCSDHINRKVTQSIFRAFDFAAARGTPLNTYVVINLRERDEAASASIFERIRRKFRVWLSYHSKKRGLTLRPIYVYAFEHTGIFPHVNWAVHVPSDLKAEFSKKLLRWVEKANGTLGPYDVSCKQIALSYAKRLAKYLVKGTDPGFVDHFHLNEVHVPQGRIWGKRAGVSPSISKAARAAAKFKPVRRSFPGWTPRASGLPSFNQIPGGALQKTQLSAP